MPLSNIHPFSAPFPFVAERAAEDSAQERDLRAYLLTPAGQAALQAGKLDEFLADLERITDEPV